jgi:hypothetical protein
LTVPSRTYFEVYLPHPPYKARSRPSSAGIFYIAGGSSESLSLLFTARSFATIRVIRNIIRNNTANMAKLSILISSLLLASSASATLWPVPAHYEQGNQTLWLSPDVTLEFGKGSYSSKACEALTLPAPLLVRALSPYLPTAADEKSTNRTAAAPIPPAAAAKLSWPPGTARSPPCLRPT